MQLQYKNFSDESRGPFRAACKAGLPQGAILMDAGYPNCDGCAASRLC
jgi:hypothetical protein